MNVGARVPSRNIDKVSSLVKKNEWNKEIFIIVQYDIKVKIITNYLSMNIEQ